MLKFNKKSEKYKHNFSGSMQEKNSNCVEKNLKGQCYENYVPFFHDFFTQLSPLQCIRIVY